MSREELEKALLSQLPTVSNTVRLDVEDLQMKIAELKMRVEELKLQTYKPFTFSPEPISPLAVIHAKYAALLKHADDTLICPVCGEPDHGNKVGEKPWCLKCNVELVEKRKMKKLIHKVIRVLSKDEAFKKELKKVNPGLFPSGEEK